MGHVNWKRDWLFLLPLLAQWIVFILVMHRLPAEIATHFTINDHGDWMANGYSKPWPFMALSTGIYLIVLSVVGRTNTLYLSKRAIWIIKGLVLLFTGGLDTILLWSAAHGGKLSGSANTAMLYVFFFLLNGFIFYIFRYGFGQDEHARPLSAKYYNIVWVLMHLLISYVTLVPLAAAAGLHVNMDGKWVELFLMAFFAIMGNIIYNIRPNAFIGIRTPWTRNNETVWRQTHHLAGILLFIAGTAGFIAVFLLGDHYGQVILWSVIVIGVLIPTIFSYFFHRRQAASNH